MIEKKDLSWNLPSGISAMLLGCGFIYSIMFSTGYWIYGNFDLAFMLTLISIVFGFFLLRKWKKSETISSKINQ